MSRVVITGITGQDGSYLAEGLLRDGHEVHGLVRQSSLVQRTRLDILPDVARAKRDGRLKLHYADLSDSSSLQHVIASVRPDLLFHLAGQSHIRISFDLPEYTADSTGLGTLRLLEAIRQNVPACRFFLAATSEIFGEPKETPQREETPFNPVNPYAAAKVYALNLVRIYRRAYGLFACAGILFNHESPRRGENYVSRKICRAVARISKGLEKELPLGALEPRRDWGYAPDTVAGMRAILSAGEPDEFVLATGVSHSVRDFCEAAFGRVGLDWREFVRHDAAHDRPTDITETRGDASKAREKLGWEPRTGFDELVRIMVDAERERLDDELRSPATER